MFVRPEKWARRIAATHWARDAELVVDFSEDVRSKLFVLDRRPHTAVLRRWLLASRRISLTALLASSLEELQESGLGVVLDVRLGGCVGGSGRAAGDDKIEASTLGVDDGEHGGQISAGRGWRGGENVPDPPPKEGRMEAEDLCTHMCTLFTF